MPGRKKPRGQRKRGGGRGRGNSRTSNNNNRATSLAEDDLQEERNPTRNSERQQRNENSTRVENPLLGSKLDVKASEWKVSSEDIDDSETEEKDITPGILRRQVLKETKKHDWELYENSLKLFHNLHAIKNKRERIDGSRSQSSASCDSEDEDVSSFKSKSTKSFKSKRHHKKKHKCQSKGNKEVIPPNKYSSLSIFPTREDIMDELPFVRSNIIYGEYENCEHYLDVQFRLFREDYISPLRDGIKEYKKCIEECKEMCMGAYDVSDIKKKLKLVNIYEDVNITNTQMDSMFGLTHVLNFKPLPPSFVWKGCSRLQEGTLLCLSSDEFVNCFIFATVTDRDDENVAKGKIKVCFEQQQYDILYDIPTSKKYTMLEMRSAYFESYRHTLSVLKEFNDDNFPLKKYIVKTEKTVDAPCYLNDKVVYDFSPILTKESFEDEEIPEHLREVPVLEFEKWPTREELGLDFTQYSVLKAALTKEFCIIQGPPGTGKTFIGLKIVKMLLHNSGWWYPENIEHECPILIVCYTNHALDQFLEKISEFTEEIVRVGEQSESELLKDLTLKNLRSEPGIYELPSDFFHRKKRLEQKQNIIKDQINTYNFVVEAASYIIFKPKILQKYIDEDHYKSLVSRPHKETGNSSIMEDWLEVPCCKNSNADVEPDCGKLESNDQDMNIEEICSWIRWESYDNRKQLSYGWNKPAYEEHKKYIQKNIFQTSMMTEEEIACVNDVWKLNLCDKWRLYRFWIAKFIAFILKTMKDLQQEFIDITKQLKETRWGKDLAIVQKKRVVGMTCTGTAKFHHLLEALSPRIVIIEEAAEVLEPHLISSLPKSTQHIILIGDHQQLRPLPSVHDLAVKFKFDVSLFERMVKNEVEYSTLVAQHRMRPCIADLLVGPIYSELSHADKVYKYDDIVGIEKNMYFISNFAAESKSDSSYCNPLEAKMVIRLTRYFLLQGYDPSLITVLATYSGQVRMIRDERKKILDENKNINLMINDVKVTTVDNYQGEENDIIIVSFVRSNYERSIGFLKAPNRVCVALSRARKGLYCFGNFDFLASESELWEKIVAKLKEQNAIGPCFSVICQKHSFVTSIEYPSDFKKVFDGGCTKVCGVMLKCGHICKRFCHSTDQEHEQYKCEEKCTKHCKRGHPCEKKCHEDCGNCTKNRFAYHPRCGHRIPVPCHVEDLSSYRCDEPCDLMLKCGHCCTKLCYENCDPCIIKVPKTLSCRHTIVVECFQDDIICTEPCRHKLPCGHPCHRRCGEQCEETCRHEIAVQLPCGHIANVLCAKRNQEIVCDASCGTLLPCGHKCPGNCTKCLQGKKHVECWLTCGKIVNGKGNCKLRCGHKNKCSVNALNKSNFSVSTKSAFGFSEKRLFVDKHRVNKWKTGFEDDDGENCF